MNRAFNNIFGETEMNYSEIDIAGVKPFLKCLIQLEITQYYFGK